jgi:RNA polymerase sigma-70 factor (ECF subfamily)
LDKKTRAKLAAAAADGDTSAFAKLYEQVYRQLYYYALSNLQSPDDAADAVQDAALQAFAGISSLREPSAFDSWIFRILMNIVKQKQKNYAITREHSLDADPSAVIGESPFGSVEMLSALNELSPEERQCLTLYGAAGYSSKEIVELTGMKASTVRSHVSRGRAKLRKALKTKEVR